jgi:hypothetical protein
LVNQQGDLKMTDNINVFDLDAFLAEAEKGAGGGTYGKFLKAKIEPGFHAYNDEKEWRDCFIAVDLTAANGMAEAREAATALGKPKIAYRLTTYQGTSVVDEGEYAMDKDYEYLFITGREETAAGWKDKFSWTVLVDSVREQIAVDMYGKEIWIHLGQKRHPLYNADNPTAYPHTRETVKFDRNTGVPVLDDNGKPKPAYHNYIAAAFNTREELVEYCLANGVEVAGNAVAPSYPIPGGWVLDAADWPECANNIMADLAGGKKTIPSLLTEWKDTGVTMADLKAMKELL